MSRAGKGQTSPRRDGEKSEIVFRPSNLRTKVPPGTLLLDAAVKAGVHLETPCGGQGRCGRCRVKLLRGEVSDHLTPHLTLEQINEGWVLACTAKVAGDAEAFVPPLKERARLAVQTAPSQIAPPITCDWMFFPMVRRFSVKLPPPSLTDNLSDLERLKKALRQEMGIDDVSLELSLARDLGHILREGNWRVSGVLRLKDTAGKAEVIELTPGRSKGRLWGAAIDIGTTNVVAALVDLRSGKTTEMVSARNKQASFGEDIISRIIYSQRENGLDELHHLVVETINELLWELAKRQNSSTPEIEDIVVAGNTTMIHFFFGLPAQSIREEPYAPLATFFPEVTAAELGLWANPRAKVHCLPAVAAYVGGDTVAGVLSSCLFEADKVTLFLDIGTNGEMVLGNREWMVAAACSAGPAFEGAGVQCGIRAVNGAIEEVSINSRTLEPTIQVIGEVPPLGICGSGMISALAEMLLTGVIDRTGHIKVDHLRRRAGGSDRVRKGDHGAEYVLAQAAETGTGEDIVLTEVDIDNLLRTKGALYAAITSMTRNLGIPISDIEEVLIGGAFGQHINIEQSIQIGLLPDLPWDRFKFLGNTSLWGAYDALISKYARGQAEEVAGKITYLELVADPGFMDEFTAAMFLPHTDIESFPSVKAVLEGVPGQRRTAKRR